MDSRRSWYGAVSALVAALVVGCGPDTSGNQNRPGTSSLSRDDSGRPPVASANRENSARPPTTVENPAAPGSTAAPTPTPPPAVTPRLMARAEIRPLDDNTVRGIVEFQQSASGDGGPLMIHVMLMGLDAGPHGMHVHTGTDCTATGMHLNPQNAPHGPANAASGSRHLGDLGNITADASGMADEMLRESLLGGDESFVGKVLVVHAGQDDLSTQPDGSSGRPIGCGVIEAAGEEVLSRGDTPNHEV
jgi:superoxide dismutase, Cu-Zn family